MAESLGDKLGFGNVDALEPNMCLFGGVIDTDGSGNIDTTNTRFVGCSVTKTGTGEYTVTYPAGPSTVIPIVQDDAGGEISVDASTPGTLVITTDPTAGPTNLANGKITVLLFAGKITHNLT